MRRTQSGTAPLQEHPFHLVYAFAHCEAWIESYSKTHNLQQDEIAKGVADLLQTQTLRGKAVGPLEDVTTPRSTVQRVNGKELQPGRTIAATKGKPGRRPMTAAARVKIAAAQRARWAKYHREQQRAAVRRRVAAA